MTTTSPNGRGRRRGVLATVALAVLLAGCGDDAPATLDGADVEDQIIDALEEIGIEVDVVCPRDVEIDEGDEFSCEVEPDDGDDFEIDVVQADGEGKVEFELPFVRLDRGEVEDAVASGLADEVDDDLEADCSEGFEGDEATFRDGDDFRCDLTGETGLTAEAEVTVDTAEDAGFTFELRGEPVPPTTTTSTTTTTTTTTVPPTLPPVTLPPVTLPPNTDDTTDDTVDTTPVTDPPSESILFDSFDNDNANGWLVVDTPGMSATITGGGTYKWVIDPNPDLNPLPFQATPEALVAEADDLDDLDVLVEMTFDGAGMAGVSCMSSEAGAYVFAVGANRSYIGEIGSDGVLTELVSEPFAVDATVDFARLVVSCFPTEEGVQLNLDLDGEDLLGFEDLDAPLTDGTAGIYMDFDAEVPAEERAITTFVFDNFEVRQF